MSLKRRLSEEKILLAPGVYDALTGLDRRTGGGGSGLSLRRVDRLHPLRQVRYRLVSMAEVADTIAAVRDRISVPLVVDADNGFGNALNVQRTVRVFERMGANAFAA